MANRYMFDTQSITKALVVIPVTLTILGNTTPANGTFSIVQGSEAVSTFARTGVGSYSLRVTDIFPTLMSAQLTFNAGSSGARIGSNLTAVVNNPTAASRVITFQVLNTSLAAADTPNAVTDTVYLTLYCKNSTAR